MTPQEAESIMSPFYPHDPNLAMRAIGTALGGNVPEWILESVVGSFFLFKEIEAVQEDMQRLIASQKDALGLNTIPYRFIQHGLSRPELN